ncbi:MAG: hypothetical protein LUC85_00405 [Bacteroidales bacterium]|nr:hypothetical protein [Bacteroidales bacterium]MCD8393280.1 hypothetical protein [Bacteroidales bacterium]
MLKKVLLGALLAVASITASAQVSITKVDRVAPTDEIYIDMATGAAKGSQYGGAAIIINNAYKCAAAGTAAIDAAKAALEKTSADMSFGTIYTVNEPTTEALRAISARGVGKVVFVNPKDKVIAAGVYPASAYDPDTTLVVNLQQIDYAPAAALVK